MADDFPAAASCRPSSPRLRVAHLSSVHMSSDVRIFVKECASLASAGHDVSLVAPHDGAASGSDVCVHEVTRRQGRLRRITGTVREVYRTARRLDADVYHFHDPELIPIGLLLKLRGKRVIYDVHEDLPRQMLCKPWLPRWCRRPLAWLVECVERPASRFFDGVVTATQSIAKRFPPSRTVVVRNYPISGELTAVAGADYEQRGADIAYVGAISEARGARAMVSALDHVPARLEARLHLAGSFLPVALEDELAGEEAWSRVVVHGYQSRAGVAALLSRVRVGLVVLEPRPNYVEALPVKLFEYMAAGLPCVASDFPLWREIVEGAGCGLLVDPSDARSVASAITWLLEHGTDAREMGERGRRAVREKYSWEGEATRLVELYDRLERPTP